MPDMSSATEEPPSEEHPSHGHDGAATSVYDLAHRCTRCGSMDLNHDESMGEIACESCGLVVSDDMVDLGPEWRSFSLEEKMNKSRVGTPGTVSEGSTFFPYKENLNFEQRKKFGKLKRQEMRGRRTDSKKRNLHNAINEMRRLTDTLGIPERLFKDAEYIYKKALDKDLVRGRSINRLVAASLYAASRARPESTLTLSELEAVSNEEEKDISRDYRLLLIELGLKMPVPDAAHYISKVASRTMDKYPKEARISVSSERLAVDILSLAMERRMSSGMDPTGLASAALYLACRELKDIYNDMATQKQIALSNDTTEVTIRNRKKNLEELPLEEMARKYIM